jgi:hypothetical protein
MKKSLICTIAVALAINWFNIANAQESSDINKSLDDAVFQEINHTDPQEGISRQVIEDALYEVIAANISPKYRTPTKEYRKLDMGKRQSHMIPSTFYVFPGNYTGRANVNEKKALEYISFGTCSEDLLSSFVQKVRGMVNFPVRDSDFIDSFYCLEFTDSSGQRHLIDAIEQDQSILVDVDNRIDIDSDGSPDLHIVLANIWGPDIFNFRTLTYGTDGKTFIQPTLPYQASFISSR